MVSRRKSLLLVLVCCAFASYVSAQSVSITFLTDWGEQATKVLEHGKALLRVVDSGANTTPGPDSVTVDLSSTLVSDWATTDLVETGNVTGVFEGMVNLTTDFYANYLADSEYLATSPQSGSLDTATATYGAVFTSAAASPSLTDFLDESAWSPADFAVGERVTVRVRDRRADLFSGPDTVEAEVVSSGGDVEALTLIETGSRSGVFEASLGLVAGAPASQDGRIQAAAGDTLTVTHPDGNGFSASSDSAAVSPATVRFIHWRKAAPADPFVEGSEVAARVVDPAANSNPAVINSVPVTFYRGNDREDVNLRETGADTGVFEGRLPLRSHSWGWNNGFLEQHSLLDISYKGRVAVAYGSLLSYADWTYSTIRLFDEAGEEASGVALGETLRVRVKAAENLYSADADSVRIRVQDTATGDDETLVLWETGGYTWLFEGDLRPEPGAAVPGDGRIQAQVGDTLLISHLDPLGLVHTSVSLPVRRSRVRYLDANGGPAPVLLEKDKARVEVLDLLAGGQPPLAGIGSLVGQDDEDLSLSPLGPPGLFRGSVPLTVDWSLDDDGILYTGWSTYPVNQPDTVVATANDASASIQVAPAILEFVDAQGEPVDSAVAGALLYVRATAPRAAGSPAAPDGMLVYATSLQGGDAEAFYLTETGPDTKVFEGSIDTADPYYPASLDVASTDTVLVRYDPVNVPYETNVDRTLATLSIIPVRLLFVDGEDRVTSTFLYNEPVRLRVEEPAANVNPNGTDTVVVKVRAWRQADDRQDVETLNLTETGADTGIFAGSLPGSAIGFSNYPSQENGVLEYPELTPPYNDTTTVVANRGDLSRNATLKDSDLWLTDLQGHDADSFPIGSTMKVWLRRPRGNVSAGIDNETVSVWTRTNVVDLETLTLVETGGSTGLFSGTLPIVASPQTSGNGTLGGSPGDPIEAHKASYSLLSFDMGVLVAATVPAAANDSAATNEDVAVAVPLLDNDYNASGAPLTIASFTQGSSGSVTVDASGRATYTPNASFHGSDSFTYTLSEPSGLTDDAVVSITVAPINDEPDAVDDSAATNAGTPVTIAVLANDTDPDGDTLRVDYAWQPSNGTATVNANGTITYTPNANFQGTDMFYYLVADGPGGPSYLTDSALVTITVQGNRAPDAVNDSATTNEDTPVTVSVTSNDTDLDGDTLTITAVTQGTKGSVSINGGASVTYTPNANANGSDSFTYTISDGNGGADSATVSITITSVNDVPDAVDDFVTTDEDVAVTVSVKSNDTDADGDSLTVTAVTQGTKGSVTINAGSTVTYTPNANANGSDSFTYTVWDGNGATDTATVSVTINPINDPPVAVADSAATLEDVSVPISVLANDSDVDGTLSVTSVTQGAKGSVTTNGTLVTYSPALNTSGADAFTYTISDGQGGTATATVTVSVSPVNDAPLAAPDNGVTRENVSISISVLANDTDVEGSSLTLVSASSPASGSASAQPNGTVSYTPQPNFTGSDTFTYAVSDGQGGSSVGQVTVLVGEALERVAVLATNSVALRTGSDVLSGDVIVNQAGAGPFLNGAELSVGGTVTTPSNYDVQGDSLTVAAGAVVGSDVRYNSLTNSGTINGSQTGSLPLPVFSALPAFLTATPGTTNISVGTNGTRTLAAGSYQDLVVGRKGTVTFTGGVYHFRTITVDREAKLYFSAASEVRVQQKLSTKNLTTIGPAAGATIDASSILLYVAGVNGTGGGLTATPKAVEIGVDNTLQANVYVPNGTIWLQDRTQATGAFLGKDIDVGADVQVTLDSAFSGGQ